MGCRLSADGFGRKANFQSFSAKRDWIGRALEANVELPTGGIGTDVRRGGAKQDIFWENAETLRALSVASRPAFKSRAFEHAGNWVIYELREPGVSGSAVARAFIEYNSRRTRDFLDAENSIWINV